MPREPRIVAAMLLAAADRLGTKNVREWHSKCATAGSVLQDAATRTYSAGVGMIIDAVESWMELDAGDAEADYIAREVAMYASRGGAWRPPELGQAHCWHTGDKRKLAKFLRHMAIFIRELP